MRVNVGSEYQERYIFDSFYRVTSEIRTIASRTYTTSFNNYNQASQLKQMTYPSTRQLSFSYDTIGRPSGMTGYLSNIGYNIAGQVSADTLGNGVTEQFGYDTNRMQLTSQKAGTASPFTNRLDLTYSYSASSGQMGSGSTAGNTGQLVTISGTINGASESAAYTYDNLGRVVTSTQTSNGSEGQRTYSYDRLGNRTAAYDDNKGIHQIQSIALQGSGGIPTNQIASVTEGSTVNYTHDAAGNLSNDGVHSYGYDSENRLVSVNGSSTASYSYDHENRRYKKTIGSSITHYVWREAQVLAEHNGSTGAVLTDYIYSGRRLIATVAGGQISYILNDRLSPRILLNTSGTLVGRQGHLSFGEGFAESGTQEKHHFTSYERDSETGTDYAINRQYPYAIGRFGRPDPYRASLVLNRPQSFNRYTYITNDPLNAIDPLGLMEYCPPGCMNLETGECDCPSTSGEPPSFDPPPHDFTSLAIDLGESAGGEGDYTAFLLMLAAIMEGVNEAIAALNAHPECLEMFGDTNPLELIPGYVASGLITISRRYTERDATGTLVTRRFDSFSVGAVTQAPATGSPLHPISNPSLSVSSRPIVINANGPYMTGLSAGRPIVGMRDSGFFGLTRAQARGAMIIHEFLHVVGARSDDGDSERSRAISVEVQQKCFH